MIGSPKNTRLPPNNKFENYLLNYQVDSTIGLMSVRSIDMQELPSGQVFVGSLFSSNNYYSELTKIGFDFEFDEKVYDRFTASSIGYLILVEKNFNGSLADVYDSSFHSVAFPASVHSSQQFVEVANQGNVLLIPWWNRYTDIVDDELNDPTLFNLSTEQSEFLLKGFHNYPKGFNQTRFGFRYFNGVNSEGRFLVIRWHNNSKNDGLTNFVRDDLIIFDAVLYENGKIEFRYAPGYFTQTAEFSSNSSVGIIANGQNRFRDFSPLLSYNPSLRTLSKFGGAVFDSSFLDEADEAGGGFISASFVCSLDQNIYWPAGDDEGAIFTFSPPLNKRKNLPRKDIKESRLIFSPNKKFGVMKNIKTFDDKNSISFISGTIVSYPTTLKSYFGEGKDALERIDIFNNDIETTGSITKAASEPFLKRDIKNSIEPFNESKLFEQSQNSDFFASGSISELESHLNSKHQVQLSFPISVVTKMFDNTSSIYFYNKREKAWKIPAESLSTTYSSSGNDSDIKPDLAYEAFNRFPEDIKGFGPIGNVVCSGSSEGPDATWLELGKQTNVNIANTYSPQTAHDALVDTYSKSIFNTDGYVARDDETFTLPISQPFVIEKAVIELPLEAGPTWFNDITTATIPFDSITERHIFDMGGPAITFALVNNIKSGYHTRKDLILSSTITHEFDYTSRNELIYYKVGGFFFPNVFKYISRGFRSFAEPSVVITQNENGFFSGTISMQAEALATNGVLVQLYKPITDDGFLSFDERNQLVFDFVKKEFLSLKNETTTNGLKLRIAQINNFGKSNRGFEPSPRSIFGREYITTQKIVTNGYFRNPMYLDPNSDEYSEFSASISLLSPQVAQITTALPLMTHIRSPYLVFPGDRLSMIVSKTRPHILGVLSDVSQSLSGSTNHDVKLVTGTVNLKLYGSYLTEGVQNQHYSTLNQELTSDGIYEIIGNEPILDQYDVFYRDELIGGMSDDFITGTLANSVTNSSFQKIIQTGSRGKVFSIYNARNSSQPTTTSKSLNLQPLFEKAGNGNLGLYVDNDERYWDTLMPSVRDVLKVDGTEIHLADNDSRLFSSSITPTVGHIFLCYISDSQYNSEWVRGFPFEPKFSTCIRVTDIARSFIATKKYTYSPATSVAIPPTLVNGMLIAYIAEDGYTRYLIDANPYSATSGSASVSDFSKCFYGFGDVSTFNTTNSVNGPNYGWTHIPDARDLAIPKSGLGWGTVERFMISPIIRGWRYGVKSALPTYSKSYFRRNRFGQFRDMLEQRDFTRYTNPSTKNTQPGVVTVRFRSGSFVVSAEETTSQNLSNEATSSLPYFDGLTRNR